MGDNHKLTTILQNLSLSNHKVSSAVQSVLENIPTVEMIEQQNLVDLCSTNVHTNHQYFQPSIVGCVMNEQFNGNDMQKKRRTRRKPRKKKNSSFPNLNEVEELATDYNEANVEENIVDDSDMCLLSEMLDNFTIQAVTSQRNGRALRIKQASRQFVRCSVGTSFNNTNSSTNIKTASSIPCSNRASNVPIIKNCSKLPVSNGSVQNALSKTNQTVDDSNLLQSTVASTSKRKQRVTRNKIKVKKNKRFFDYISKEDAQKGLLSGDFIKGVVRINAKNYKEAYVNNKDRSQQDFLISSLLDRNRALEGDEVVLKLKPSVEWREKQKTAYVVYIDKKVHSRTGVGFLKIDKNPQFAIFIPRDSRIPRMHIPFKECPTEFYQNPNKYKDVLFSAKIKDWVNMHYALGSLLGKIGAFGDIQSETAALLLENELDITPPPAEVLKFLPEMKEIPSSEFSYREDLRKDCIFTIDPSTAKDLDDAVSCKELPNGNLEIGVHISDVAFYLAEENPLDEFVSKKATTIYLVDNVYHMLPKVLCTYCSLLPGLDKCAFSVFWEMTKKGEVLNHRFARSVINSCAQLSYEHAQMMIENDQEEFKDDTLEIHNGFGASDLCKIVNYLQNIATVLRGKRFENGALRIDQPKLVFRLDEAGKPLAWSVYENKASHQLIEEFMLLANITVATKILDDFPNLAFLRCHDPPAQHMLIELQKSMKDAGIDLDISSSSQIQRSLSQYKAANQSASQMAALNHLLAKPMTRARYFCSAVIEDDSELHHYALNIPIYTHFTSPIRRYADIMVHRLLAASLGYTEKVRWNVDYVQEIAANCNKQKYNAKRAGEASCDLFFARYVEEHQPFEQDAVVVDVKDRSFDVIVLATGHAVRIYDNNCDENVHWKHERDRNRNKIVVHFPRTNECLEDTCEIKIFSVVKVQLQRKQKTHKLEGKLLRPITSLTFNSTK